VSDGDGISRAGGREGNADVRDVSVCVIYS